MKKILLLFVVFLASSTITFAQSHPTELKFQNNRTRYVREHFVDGEDASSGFDYIYFKSGKQFVMIRSIWSASHTRELRVEDMYFENGELVFFRESTAKKNAMTALKAGRNTGLLKVDEMHFEKGKLKKWIEDGKPVTTQDQWPEAERSTLEKAKSLTDYYTDLKNDHQ